jgi:hypothetical protein
MFKGRGRGGGGGGREEKKPLIQQPPPSVTPQERQELDTVLERIWDLHAALPPGQRQQLLQAIRNILDGSG